MVLKTTKKKLNEMKMENETYYIHIYGLWKLKRNHIIDAKYYVKEVLSLPARWGNPLISSLSLYFTIRLKIRSSIRLNGSDDDDDDVAGGAKPSVNVVVVVDVV